MLSAGIDTVNWREVPRKEANKKNRMGGRIAAHHGVAQTKDYEGPRYITCTYVPSLTL